MILLDPFLGPLDKVTVVLLILVFSFVKRSQKSFLCSHKKQNNKFTFWLN